MQRVSKTYKKSMKSSLRERGYILVTFGLINQEAQNNATFVKQNLTYYSDRSKCEIFELADNEEYPEYATLEQNFLRVDGTMLIPPKPSETGIGLYRDTGVVSADLISQGSFDLVIHLNILPTDFKGMTLHFGRNYPVNFDIIGNENTLQVRNNHNSKYSTEYVFTNTSHLTIRVYKMCNNDNRFRLHYIQFGYALLYRNNSVMDSELTSSMSPIGAEIPQINFTLKVKNFDKYFNVDNPNSAINFLETGQEINVMYGYQLPDSEDIEWIQGQHLWCAEWKSDDTSATIKCQDIFRNLNEEYYKGKYYSNGRSFYNLVYDVIDDAGVDRSYIYVDPRLQTLYTKNPIPRVTHKEALQIIANACRCTLIQSRNGQIQIKSNFVATPSSTSSDGTSFSHAENVVVDDVKDEYATLATNYTVVNGRMKLLGNGTITGNTGFVSNAVSKADGTFNDNPIVTITMDAIDIYGSFTFRFGNALPKEFIIRTYNNNVLGETFTITEDEIDTLCTIVRDYPELDKLELEFTKTSEPYSRIVLNNFVLSEVADFTMERRDMTDSPTATKLESVKNVVVSCYIYQNDDEEINLISQDLTVTSGDEEIFYLQHPAYNYSATFNSSANNVTIVESGAYYIKVRFNISGTYKLVISGHEYKIIEMTKSKNINNRGTTITWDNPLVSNGSIGNDLVNWLADYYSSEVDYEYSTRGNPELDVNDIIYQENDFIDRMKVHIYQHTIGFSQGFSGKINARRIGG